MPDRVEKAAEAALKPLWEIFITGYGSRVQLRWTNSLHPEQIPLIFLDQAKQIAEQQFAARRRENPLIVVPKPNGG